MKSTNSIIKSVKAAIAFGLLSFGVCASAFADNPMLRITCEGKNTGARIYVNGKLKGECPLDMQVPPGRVRLVGVVPHNDEFDVVWEQTVTLSEDVVKKLEVNVKHLHFNERLQRQFAPEAPETLKKAEQGDVKKMYSLFDFYHQGFGLPQSDEKAAAWLRKAADLGNERAMTQLGYCYLEGDAGFPEDKKQAIDWFRKAADKGDANAVQALGILEK
jgi:TPR repeat protein